ncbi:MAG: DUF4359 domain-containing protein [Aphanothece sp. CMT-3BRIN-NPC111]|jgi:hypothetical protein|nr:DUF4359 domain-containing protein [Aphanothece sp. CMT-3BRIN-NPC111]
MKGLQVITVVGGIALVGLGVAMTLTNPGQDVYEEYAAQLLTEYLQENICPKAPAILGNSLQGQCRSLVDSSQSEIKQLISQGTQRQNFIVFSLYKTDLSINKVVPFLPSNLLPSYHAETVGALENFYTYQLEKQ